jgi:pimeloyl-ACP methyl ester carboxylesterase
MARAFFGFDGTGSQNWSQVDLRRSFVHKMVNQAITDHRFYYLGSDDAGGNTENIINRALGRAAGVIDNKGVTEINVAGYSRGGFIAVVFCAALKELFPKVKVPVMTLFDPVDRNLSVRVSGGKNARSPQQGADGTTITNNVKFVIRAVRDPAYGSRLYMDNCGLWNETGPNIIHNKFSCSHSGAGGLPWDAAFFENGNITQALAAGDPAQAQNKIAALGVTYRGKSRLAIFEKRCSLNEATDRKGSYELGAWVWKYLAKREVVPEGASFSRNLPVLDDMIYTNTGGADVTATSAVGW